MDDPGRQDVKRAGVGMQLFDGCAGLRVEASDHHIRVGGQFFDEYCGQWPQRLDLARAREGRYSVKPRSAATVTHDWTANPPLAHAATALASRTFPPTSKS